MVFFFVSKIFMLLTLIGATRSCEIVGLSHVRRKLFQKFQPVYLMFIRGSFSNGNIKPLSGTPLLFPIWLHQSSMQTLFHPVYATTTFIEEIGSFSRKVIMKIMI